MKRLCDWSGRNDRSGPTVFSNGAGPPALLYRLGKLGRRYKEAFGFGFVVVCGLMVGVVGLTIANSMLSASQQETQNALKEAGDNFQSAQTRAAAALAQLSQLDKNTQ